MALATYLSQVRLLLNDPNGTTYSTPALTSYINGARGHIASRGQCVRILPAISGPVQSVTLSTAGTGYNLAPTVTISAPDYPSGLAPWPNGLQATATAVLSGTAVKSVTLTSGGSGYFQPTVTFTATSGGSGATAVATVSGAMQTITYQEVYNFANIPVTANSGVASVIAVKSVSVIWGSFRYTCNRVSWSRYQAMYRNYTAGYYFTPGVWAQYGQGVNGSIYLYPIPNQAYQLELDCICLPIDLGTDTDPEAIPYPWIDAIKYYVAYLATTGAQRNTDADRFYKLYEAHMNQARADSQPGAISSWYGSNV